MSAAGGGAVARMGATGGGAVAKPTQKLLRGEEAVKLAKREIHYYLRRFKRPHSLLQLWENTCKKKGVSRASVQSALARLVESAIVSTKLYGKFAICHLNPEQCASGAPDTGRSRRDQLLDAPGGARRNQHGDHGAAPNRTSHRLPRDTADERGARSPARRRVSPTLSPTPSAPLGTTRRSRLV